MTDYNYRGPVVVLDLDDTLAPEKLYLLSGFRFAAHWLGSRFAADGVEAEEVISLMQEALDRKENYYDRLEEYLTHHNLESRPIMEELVPAVRDHQPDEGYKFFDDTAEVLNSLRDRGIRMALITDGRANTQRRKVEALGLDAYFHPDLVFISGERGADKHSPDSFAAVVRAFPEAAGFCYVGDNPEKDFYHPNLLGWETYCRLAPAEGGNIFEQPDRPFPYGAKNKICSLTELPY